MSALGSHVALHAGSFCPCICTLQSAALVPIATYLSVCFWWVAPTGYLLCYDNERLAHLAAFLLSYDDKQQNANVALHPIGMQVQA